MVKGKTEGLTQGNSLRLLERKRSRELACVSSAELCSESRVFKPVQRAKLRLEITKSKFAVGEAHTGLRRHESSPSPLNGRGSERGGTKESAGKLTRLVAHRQVSRTLESSLSSSRFTPTPPTLFLRSLLIPSRHIIKVSFAIQHTWQQRQTTTAMATRDIRDDQQDTKDGQMAIGSA